MKKTLILVACIIAMHAVSAQVSMVRQEPHFIDNTETIIRGYGDSKTITCTNMQSGSAVFIYSEAPFSQTIEYILDGYRINDMVCENDTVFFCGNNMDKENQLGILGFFSISEAFFNGGPSKIFIQDTLYAGEDWRLVEDLTRLVAYVGSDNVTRHVVCIGNCKKNYPCVVDFNPDFGGNYVGGYVNSQKESFCDIKMVSEYYGQIVKKYLATAGFETTYGVYLNLRLYDIDNVITNLGMQDDLYTFAVDTSDTREWDLNGVLITPLSDNNIATVSYRKCSTGNNSVNTCVSVYDVHRIATGNLYSMVHNLEIVQEDFVHTCTLHRAIYKKPTQTLAFLHTFVGKQLVSSSSVFYEIDYTNITNPSAPRPYCHPTHLLQGMDNYNGTSQYVMSGYEKTSPSTLKYEFETFSFTPLCPENPLCEYVFKPLVFAIGRENKFNSHAFISAMKEKGTDYGEYPVLYECGE